jgi:hypothetical protein
MNDHDGAGVIPGRYAGEANPIHDGPTPVLIAAAEQRMYADGLAGRISAAAAEAARCQSVLLELLGEFDAIGAIRFWNDFKSLAHWLSWSCAMTPGVAREHVRVAKALRRMPTIAGLFREIDRLYNSLLRAVIFRPESVFTRSQAPLLPPSRRQENCRDASSARCLC